MDVKQHFTKLNHHLCTESQYKNLTARVICLKCFNCPTVRPYNQSVFSVRGIQYFLLTKCANLSFFPHLLCYFFKLQTFEICQNSKLFVSHFSGLTLITNFCQFLSDVIFSCWLSLEGGLLYAFVGPAAAVVLVNTEISQQRKATSFPLERHFRIVQKC